MNQPTIVFKHMVDKLAKPGAQLQNSLTPIKCELLHATLGVAGEHLELAMAHQNNDKENFIEEAGDLLFYLQIVCTHLNLDSVEQMLESSPMESEDVSMIGTHVESFIDTIKRHVIYEFELNRKALEKAIRGILNEVSVAIYETFDVCIAEAIEANKSKLAVRYQGFEYSNRSAEQRKDKES